MKGPRLILSAIASCDSPERLECTNELERSGTGCKGTFECWDDSVPVKRLYIVERDGSAGNYACDCVDVVNVIESYTSKSFCDMTLPQRLSEARDKCGFSRL